MSEKALYFFQVDQSIAQILGSIFIPIDYYLLQDSLVEPNKRGKMLLRILAYLLLRGKGISLKGNEWNRA